MLGGAACSSSTTSTTSTLGTSTLGTSAVATSTPGSGSTTPGTSTAPAGGTSIPSKATIVAFDMPASINCVGTADITLPATYTTKGATSVELLVDGFEVAGTPPLSGTYDVPLRCDGTAKTVILTAIDADGHPTIKSKAVLTSTEPQGD